MGYLALSEEEKLNREILQRLTAIEQNTKNLDEVMHTATTAKNIAENNVKRIENLEEGQNSNKRWLMGILASVIAYVITTYFIRR